jgi:hypothetical protein
MSFRKYFDRIFGTEKHDVSRPIISRNSVMDEIEGKQEQICRKFGAIYEPLIGA